MKLFSHFFWVCLFVRKLYNTSESYYGKYGRSRGVKDVDIQLHFSTEIYTTSLLDGKFENDGLRLFR